VFSIIELTDRNRYNPVHHHHRAAKVPENAQKNSRVKRPHGRHPDHPYRGSAIILLTVRKVRVSLAELGRQPAVGAASPDGADYRCHHLASFGREGGTSRLTANGGGYAINARPRHLNVTGSRTLYSDPEHGAPQKTTATKPAPLTVQRRVKVGLRLK